MHDTCTVLYNVMYACTKVHTYLSVTSLKLKQKIGLHRISKVYCTVIVITRAYVCYMHLKPQINYTLLAGERTPPPRIGDGDARPPRASVRLR